MGKGVLFREVSSFQRCPYREVPLYNNCKSSLVCIVYTSMCVCCVCSGAEIPRRPAVKKLSPPFTIELRPMEIRTFNITVEYNSGRGRA